MKNLATFLMEFLRDLEDVIPPPENAHHSVTYAQYGDDTHGWKDMLALSIQQGGGKRPQIFFLTDEDFSKDSKELISEIKILMTDAGKRESLSVGPGELA